MHALAGSSRGRGATNASGKFLLLLLLLPLLARLLLHLVLGEPRRGRLERFRSHRARSRRLLSEARSVQTLRERDPLRGRRDGLPERAVERTGLLDRAQTEHHGGAAHVDGGRQLEERGEKDQARRDAHRDADTGSFSKKGVEEGKDAAVDGCGAERSRSYLQVNSGNGNVRYMCCVILSFRASNGYLIRCKLWRKIAKLRGRGPSSGQL